MSGELSDVHKTTKLVSSLGGPSLELEELEQVTNLEAGRALFAWLAAQSDAFDFEKYKRAEIGSDVDDEAKLNKQVYAVTRDLVLERDEVLIHNSLQAPETMTDGPGIQESLTNYMPPTRLQKHAEYINSETEMVHRETELLRSRIAQTKAASKKILHSIKLLQKAVYDLELQINDSDERVSELSITADTTMSSTISHFQGLLHGLGYSEQNEDSHDPDEDLQLESARNILMTAKVKTSSATGSLRDTVQNITVLRQEEPAKLADLQMEANRLQKAFDDIQLQASPTEDDDATVSKELEEICAFLEHEAALMDANKEYESEALDNLLSEVQGYIAEERREVSVEQAVWRAWALDQAAITKLHDIALDQATSSLDRTLEPLELVYASLSRLARSVQEAEALLEAFIEELGDIHIYGTPIKENRIASASGGDAEMEQRLINVFNKHKDLRSSGSVPLAILDQEDVLAELRLLKVRSAHVEAPERNWADDILQTCSIRPIHPMLPQIYANSPLISCPPFAYPVHVRDLKTQARKKSGELQILASSLEDEVRETFAKENNTKRLTTFVNKWCGID